MTATPSHAAARPTSPRRAAWLTVAVVAVAAPYGIMALSGSTVDELVAEDGVVEWVGALALLAGAAMYAAAFLRELRLGAASGRSRLGTWLVLALAAALLFLGLEEISWGQRLFGWGTPEALSEVNAQDETTLHNLQPFQGTVLDGDRLFRLGWGVLFVLLPIAAALVPRWRGWLRRTVPLVPLWLSGLFVATYAFSRLAVELLGGEGWDATYAAGSAATEIQEMLIEVLMGVAAFLTLRDMRRRAASC